MRGSRRLISLRTAAWFAYCGAVISIVQIALLMVFFIVGQPYGTLNDVAFVVQDLLALPLLLALHQLLRERAPTESTVALALGVTGVFAIAVLQILLIAHVLTFSQEGGPVTFALFALFGGWMLMAGYLCRAQMLMQHSVAFSIIGWSYIGYPVWAFWLGRQLTALNDRGSAI